MKIISLICLLVLSAFANKLQVTVSIVPQHYFVQKIAQDRVNVNVMVQPGFSPATYEPKTSQMKDLANSSAYFSIGVPFEKVWLERFKSANKNLNIVDTTKGIVKLPMEEHFHDDKKHDEHAHHDEKNSEHDHEHESLDPHVWLDPLLVKTQAKIIYETLATLDEKNASFYKTNYEAFLIELDDLYLELKNILIPVQNKAFMVFHPSWGYFAHRFDLEQIAVEVSGKEPKPNQLVTLIQEAKKHNIKTVFVAPEFSQKSAKVIASSIKGTVFSVSPLQLKWKENLIFAAHSIVDSYK
ncbi:MAG: zinc ABC transporter substrate-binding protein [Arcobacteraceae bacterium]